MAPRSYLKSLLLFCLYFIFAVIITWPLLPNISTVIPIGTERTTTIPLFGLWTLIWNAAQLPHLFSGYWDAPIFYPVHGTFAFSETMFPQGLVFSLGMSLCGEPLTVYNLMLLLSLALNGLAAFSLLRVIGISDFPAGLAGLITVALPYAANEMGVCQLVVLFPIFYFFSRLYQFSRTPTLKHALLMGLWGGVLALSCSYYGLFLSVFSILGAVTLFNRRTFSIGAIIRLMAGICLAGVLAMPILIRQLAITAGFSHNLQAMVLRSCRITDYLALTPVAFGAGITPWLRPGGAYHPMYPGTGLLLLGLAGIWLGRDRAPRWVLFCALGAILAMVLSLGINFNLLGWNLLEFLKGFYPGFKQLRNAFRFGVFVQIFLIGLAGFTLERLYRIKNTRSLLLLMMVFLLSIIEVLPVTRLRPVPSDVFSAPWSDYLATQPEGPALMLPMAAEDERVDYHYLPIVAGMIQAIYNGQPLLNGLSSFRPQHYLELKDKMQRFPDPDSLACLCDNGVDYLIVDKNYLTAKRGSVLNNDPHFQLLYADGIKHIYSVSCPNSEGHL